MKVPYRQSSDDEEYLDVSMPSTLKSNGLKSNVWIAFIHGGAWISTSDFSHVSQGFTDLGYTYFEVGYRLSSKQIDGKTQFPRHLDDVLVGLNLIYSQQILSLVGEPIPKPLVLVGHSAGAQLACLAASKLSFVAGVIGVEGIYDIPLLLKSYPSYLDWFIAKAFDPKDYLVASPTTYSSSLPTLILYSTDDELVDEIQSTKYFDCCTGPREFGHLNGSHDNVLKSGTFFTKCHAFIQSLQQQHQ